MAIFTKAVIPDTRKKRAYPEGAILSLLLNTHIAFRKKETEITIMNVMSEKIVINGP
jgi:hypothetical protein